MRTCRRIECRIKLVNNEKYVRYQALFPTTIKNGKSVHEIPFGAIERPEGIEFPAQNWVDYGDGKRRAGGSELRPARQRHDRRHDDGLAAPGAHAGRLWVRRRLRAGHVVRVGLSTGQGADDAPMPWCLIPAAGEVGGSSRRAAQFLDPLIARVVAPHEGPLTSGWGFLDISASERGALRREARSRSGGIVVRVYESAGKATSQAYLKLHARISSAFEANLLEDPGQALPVQDDGVRFDLHPYEIKTFLFQLGPRRAR